MAASCNGRHTVVSLIFATSPQRWASRAISTVLRRDKGRPRVAGNSQARARTCTTTSGGKDPGAARARAFLQAREALLEKALAPQADHFAPGRQRRGDLIVGQALRDRKSTRLNSSHT